MTENQQQEKYYIKNDDKYAEIAEERSGHNDQSRN
jgi:hypothetical protein